VLYVRVLKEMISLRIVFGSLRFDRAKGTHLVLSGTNCSTANIGLVELIRLMGQKMPKSY
jgi:hypothetical protein